MKKLVTNANQHVGNSPGTLTYTGQRPTGYVKATFWRQGDTSVGELEMTDARLKKLETRRTEPQWINVSGLNDLEFLKSIGGQFKIHPLFLEDILNSAQRPKVESIEDSLLVCLKALSMDKNNELKVHSVNLVISGNTVFSFSDLGADEWLQPIFKRLNNKNGALQLKGVYYVLYALIDVLVDQYFSVLENLGDKIQLIDESVYKQSDDIQLDALYQLKKQLIYLSKQTSPVPEFIRKIPNELDDKSWQEVKIYFDDLLDHSLQVQDISRSYLESMNNLFDLYFSLVNLRMNRTIQALTVMTVVFLPLTLLAGIYGMNFAYMPGLLEPQAFWWVMIGMLVLSILILFFLKRQRWF